MRVRIRSMRVRDALMAFDQFLFAEGLEFEAVVIGAAALVIMEVVSRETMDVDFLDPKISPAILDAADRFRRARPEFRLDAHWINNGPESLVRDLPTEWRERTRLIFQGQALVLHTLSRHDLLCTKLFAYCDRGDDLADCVALQPTPEELRECVSWVIARDANPLWPEHVARQFKILSMRLGHANA